MDQLVLLTLFYIKRGYTIREMAADCGRSIGTIQKHFRDLEEGGYVVKPTGPRKAKNRKLTEKGLELLRQEHLLGE